MAAMRRTVLATAGVLGLLAAGVPGFMAFVALPAPPHPYFEGEQPRVQVIAHRGGAHLRPENTLEAFAHAVRLGADILETDVRATADGEIVCLHDATLERTTDGAGPLAAFTLAELRRLDAGYRWSQDGGLSYPFRGKGIAVPSLAEVLQALPRARLVVEMKPAEPAFAEALCALIRRHGAARRVLVASFAHEPMLAFRAACPEVATSLSAREAGVFHALHRWGLAALYPAPAPALQMPARLRDTELATPELLAAARGRNFRVHVWTVNDEERMVRLARLGVHGIMTDRPDLLLRSLAALAGGSPPRRRRHAGRKAVL
jgi:glycerophosphoryl diester phosphodiesterase